MQPTEIAQIDARADFAELQNIADEQLLLAATDHMNEFTDSELVTLMTF